MKYYIGKYWLMANSEDADVREEGQRLWDETARKYDYQSVRTHLPSRFLKNFERNNWFHDFYIDGINMVNHDKQRSDLELCISHDDLAYKITMSGIKSLNMNMPDNKLWIFGKLMWGYSEFEVNPDNTLTLRILCDFECEVEARFVKISAAKAERSVEYPSGRMFRME